MECGVFLLPESSFLRGGDSKGVGLNSLKEVRPGEQAFKWEEG